MIDAVRRRPKVDAHGVAHMGAVQANGWALRAILSEASRQIDADPPGSYQEQSTAVPYRLRGHKKLYFPDVAVLDNDGRLIIVEVKPCPSVR